MLIFVIRLLGTIRLAEGDIQYNPLTGRGSKGIADITQFSHQLSTKPRTAKLSIHLMFVHYHTASIMTRQARDSSDTPMPSKDLIAPDGVSSAEAAGVGIL